MSRSSAATISLGDRLLEVFSAILLVAALWSIQALIGGTRLLFALPAYALLVIAGAASILVLRSSKPRPHRICFWSTALLCSYIVARAFLSPAPDLAMIEVASVVSGLVVYFLTACVITSAKARMWIMACLLAAGLAHVFVGAIQFRGGDNYMPISFLQRFDYGYRASGFYICPNHLAGLLEVLAIFGLSLVCWSRWPVWSKLLIGYAVAACYLGVILTGSRGGYLSVVASLLVFAWLSLRILRAVSARLAVRLGLAGAAAAIVAIVAAGLVIRESSYLNERTRKAVTDKAFRLDLWQAAIEQWKLSPVFGTGTGTYLFYGRKFRTERMQLDPIYAHNDYLELLAEYGVVGAVVFIFFFAAHWQRGWADAARLGPKRIAVSQRLASNAMAMNLGALSAAGAYVVHSIFDFNLHIPANILLLAFVFGIIANPGVSYEAPAEGRRRRLMPWRFVLFALSLVLGLQIWRAAPAEYYTEKARTALRDYRFLLATDFALRALAHDNKNPLAYYYLGRARTMGGDAQDMPEAATSFYTAAAAAFEEARALAPLDQTYTVELALTYDSLDRYPEAEWLFGEARAMDPKSISLARYYEAHLQRWRAGGLPPET